MVCAAVVSSAPSLEGMVLCYCGDAGVAIETGSTRCADLPVVGTPTPETGTPTFADSHCGTCVDLPLGNPSASIGKTRPASPKLLATALALVPTHLLPGAPAAVVAAAGERLPPFPALSSSPTSSPLRC